MKKVVVCILVAFLSSGCASIFVSKNQKVNFTTEGESTFTLDDQEMGKGPKTSKVEKNGDAKQLISKKEGYKDRYSVMMPVRRQPGFWALQPFNVGWLLIYGYYLDFALPKLVAYPKQVVVSEEKSNKLPIKEKEQKYISISNIKLNIKNSDKDLKDLYITYAGSRTDNQILEAEKRAEKLQTKEELAELKRAQKGKATTTTKDNDIKYDDTKFTDDVYNTLKKTGYIDTVNMFFADNNNTMFIEGSIEKIYAFHVTGRMFSKYMRTKLYMTWYIKNYYNEVIDSIKTVEYSGDFSKDYYIEGQALIKSVGDAIDLSFLRLHDHPSFKKYIKMESDFTIKDSVLTLTKQDSIIRDRGDAGAASVIVKTKNGHGSGFAITADGYVITNYHVIAQDTEGIKIINSNGVSMDCKVVRYNKYRDLALLKVDMKFEKVFNVTNEKSFKNLQDVYTIGAPKSVELGQTVSTGLISNERNNNNNPLLQLNMAVNSGNSGGPVFDGKGTLHGVIVTKAVGKNTEGICFAIPGYLIASYLNIKFK